MNLQTFKNNSFSFRERFYSFILLFFYSFILKRQLNRNALNCGDRITDWAPRSASHIMFLDRHNVKCPPSYFLTRFQLEREETMILPMFGTPTRVVICLFIKGETPKIQLLLHVDKSMRLKNERKGISREKTLCTCLGF